MVKTTPAALIHMAGGFIIGVSGLVGLPVLHLVLTREKYQETETYVDPDTNKKRLTNIAWSDLQEWATGAVVGLAVHTAGLAYLTLHATGVM